MILMMIDIAVGVVNTGVLLSCECRVLKRAVFRPSEFSEFI